MTINRIREGCVGSGFTIHNCFAFTLLPNKTHKLNISYLLNYVQCEQSVPITFILKDGREVTMELAFIMKRMDLEILAAFNISRYKYNIYIYI